MSLNIDDFKSKLTGGGARSNLFRATVTYPGYAAGDVELTSFMCKSAQLPASTIETIAVPFRGSRVPSRHLSVRSTCHMTPRTRSKSSRLSFRLTTGNQERQP